MKTFLGILLITITSITNAQVTCTHPDYEFLMSVYNNTGGADWKNNTGWKEGAEGTSCEPCNGWYGITCEDDRVVRIDLEDNGLEGEISVLNLVGNPQLREIDFSHNALTGIIPATIDRFQLFDCSNNLLTGTLPFPLFFIDVFDCSNNQLTGEIPPYIDFVPEIFNCSNNQLTGSIPSFEAFGPQTFDCSFNDLNGTIPDIILWQNEINFNFSNNSLQGTLPDIQPFEKVSTLNLSNNQLSGCIPDVYCDLLDNSSEVDLSGNGLLPFQGDLLAYCEGGVSENAPCDDGLPYTDGDIIQSDCVCLGISTDSTYLSIDIENSVCGVAGRETHVPVRVYQYRDVAALQFTISSSDTSFAEIVGWSGIHPQSGLPASAFGVLNKKLKVVYADETGRMLPDSAVLFNVRLKLKDGAQTRATLFFEDELLILNNNVVEIQVLPASGSVCVSPQSSAVACPSDAVVPKPPVVGDAVCRQIITPAGPVEDNTNDGCERTRTFTWTYTDCEQNAFDWTYTYTIDKSEFVLPEPEGATVSCAGLTEEIPVPPVVIDACGDEVIPEGPVVGDTPECGGTRTYTWTYTDCEGIEQDWVFTYTVEPAELQVACPDTEIYCQNVDGFYDAPLIEYSNQCEQSTDVFFNITGATIREGEGDIASGEFNPGVSYLNWLVVSACDTAQCITEITIAPLSTSETTVNTCGAYVWNDETYTESGTYEYYGQNQAGCDSIAYLNLTIDEAITSTQTETACDVYEWNGNTYTESGTYTFATTTAGGCDSIVTLILTINGISESAATQTACEEYIWNGTKYTSSGTYTYTTTNANGCDSIATLNLNINSITTSSESATACETYNWNGTTYTNSGTYTYTTTNANGCDSIATLNLTINGISTSTESQTACEEYTWNGTTYTNSGIYTYQTQNANGCDSIATLNLTINGISTSTESQTACEEYTWNGIKYTNSGTYTYQTQNANGCDSIATLNLIINPSTNSTEEVTACEEYTWNGSTYTSSGTYTYTTINVSGCDSLATLNLTILEAPCGGADEVELNIDDAVCGQTESIICVPVRTRNFEGIAALQLAIRSEDTTRAEILGICDIHPESGLDASDFAVLDQRLVMVTPNLEMSLADSSVLFSVQVRLRDSLEGTVALLFDGDIQALSNDFEKIDVIGTEGSVCIKKATVRVSGRITTYNDKGVNSVRVTASSLAGPESTDSTDVAGNYIIEDLEKGADYTIAPACVGELLNGVDVTDLLIMRRHLLGVSVFNNPYLFVAADLNFDKLVDLTDLLYLRRLLVGSIDSLPGGADSWRFIPASYSFPGAGNVLAGPLPNQIELTSVGVDLSDQDFIGVKYGDLNNSAGPNPFSSSETEIRGASEPALLVSAAEGSAGAEIWIDVTSKNFTGGAVMQFSLAWPSDKLALVSVPDDKDEIRIEGTTSIDERFINRGLLSFIWESDDVLDGTTLPDNTVCYRLKFRVLDTQTGMADIASSAEIRSPKFVNGNLQEFDLAVEAGKVTITESSAVEQDYSSVGIYPNPTTGILHLDYGSHSPQAVTLQTMEGTVLKKVSGSEKTMDLSDLTAGVYMVKMQFGQGMVSRKVIVIK